MPTLLRALEYCNKLDLELDEKKRLHRIRKSRKWDCQPVEYKAMTCGGRLPPLQKIWVAKRSKYKKTIDDWNPSAVPNRRKLQPIDQRRRRSSGWNVSKSRARILAVMKSTEAASKVKSGLPFTKRDFDRLKCCFEALDVDGNGVLDYEELQEVGDFCGFKVDHQTFEKMDTDDSGTIEFCEMLLLIYPNCPTRDITLAIAKWDPEAPDLVWSDHFEQDDAAEIEQVFSFFSDSERYLTADGLRKKLSKTISTEYINSLISEFGYNGTMTVSQFADMMYNNYNR